MKLRNIFTAILIASTACLVSCDKIMNKAMEKVMESAFNHDYQDSEKWGKVVTVDLPTLGFDEIELSGAIRLEYTQDSTYSLQVYGNEKAIEAYTISSEDNELEASLKEGTGSVNKNTPAITLRITAPYLTDIQAMGAAEVVFMDSIAQDKDLDVNVSGAGKIKLGNFKAKDIEVSIIGAGNVDGKIDCQKLKVKISGAGNGYLDIYCRQAKFTLSGAANVVVSGECKDFSYTALGSSSLTKDYLNTGEEKEKIEE